MGKTEVTLIVSPVATPPAMSQSFVPSKPPFIAANRLTTRMGMLVVVLILCLMAAASLAVQAGATTQGESSAANFTVSAGPVVGLVAVPTSPPLVLGVVTYRTTSTKIAGATVSVAGPSTMQNTTDASGNYTVSIAADGLHTVTPSLSGQVNGISSLDAAYIAQCVTGLHAMSDCPMLAADTSGNNVLSSLDAAQIAQYLVGLGGANTRVGRWVFNPASRSYNTGTPNRFNENFAAYLVGEVSGNWQPPAATAAQQADQPATAPLLYRQHLPLIGK